MSERIAAVGCLFMLAACSGPAPETESAAAPLSPPPAKSEPEAATVVYECEGGSAIVAQVLDKQALVWMPGSPEPAKLSQVAAASGAKFSDGRLTFWTKDETALIEHDDVLFFRDCTVNHAKVPWERARVNGARYRGVGQEPGWSVEVFEGDRIVYIGDYGDTFQEFPSPEPEVEEGTGATVYRTSNGNGNELAVTVRRAPCQDVMSGEQFEARVTVAFNGEQYDGCGRIYR